MTVTEIETIDHLDFHLEDTCESVNGCSNTAEWMFVAPADPCPSSVLCNSCKTETQKWIEQTIFPIYCLRCGATQNTEEIRWERL